MEKVKLPKEVAEAIDSMKADGMSDQQIIYKALGDVSDESLDKFSTLTDLSYDGKDGFHRIMNALVNGYEVEETREDKVRAYIEWRRKEMASLVEETPHHTRTKYRREGAIEIAKILGIEGVNS